MFVSSASLLFLVWISSAGALTSTSTTQQHQQYDVVIVGGGSAGLTAAKLSCNVFGKSAVLIEKEKLGGDCTWTGCVPSKSLLAAANSVHAARQYGFTQKPNFAEIKQSIVDKRKIIYDADDSPEAMAKLGVATIAGMATLRSATQVQVRTSGGDETTLTAKEGVILCTGAEPRLPKDIVGLETVDYLTYESIWDIEEIPDRLTVLGGGPIGCELAQAFSRLGADVTIVAPSLLPREDSDVGDVMEKVFSSEGISIVKGRACAVEASAKAARGSRSVHSITVSQAGGNQESVQGDALLVALGRTPRVKGFGLEEVGIALSTNGGIEVNDQLQTSVKGIYASGDCTGDRQL